MYAVSLHTDKKEKKFFLIYMEILRGAVAKSYIRKCASISTYMRRSLVIYDFSTASFWIFLYCIWGKFDFLFSTPLHIPEVGNCRFKFCVSVFLSVALCSCSLSVPIILSSYVGVNASSTVFTKHAVNMYYISVQQSPISRTELKLSLSNFFPKIVASILSLAFLKIACKNMQKVLKLKRNFKKIRERFLKK
jgi:hypothetical protein